MTSLKLTVISKPYQISELISQDIRTVDTACDWLIRDFKQIATDGTDTAVGSKFPPKRDTAHVRRLHPTAA